MLPNSDLSVRGRQCDPCKYPFSYSLAALACRRFGSTIGLAITPVATARRSVRKNCRELHVGIEVNKGRFVK